MIPLFDISLRFDDEIRILNFDIFKICLFSIIAILLGQRHKY